MTAGSSDELRSSAPAGTRLGVAILTHGPGSEYEPLLRGLVADGIAPESIVVAHNPTSPTDPDLRPSVAGVRVARAPRNLGYGGGMNTGIGALREGDFTHVLLLTRDVVLRPGALAALLSAAASAPEFGVLGPVQRELTGGQPWSYGGVLHRNGRAEHMRELKNTGAGSIAPCDWIDGGAMLLRIDALDRGGGFDETLYHYCDDVDLCLRLQRAGWRIGVVLDTVSEQEYGELKRPGAYAYLMARNELELARRAAGPWGVLCGLVRLAKECASLAWLRVKPGLADDERALTSARLKGRLRGAGAFLTRRFGPPPGSLSGLGDMRS